MSKYKVDGKYICECQKSFDKAQSLNAHFSHCLIHRNGEPNKREHVRQGKMSGWDKFTFEDRQKFAKKAHETFKKSGKKKKLSEETKKKLSISLKGKTGGVREGSNKWKGIYVIQNNNKIWLDSSYEKRFIEILNKLNISWIKNKKRFPYTYEGTHRKYIPDFYIPEFDIWIEVKGMEKPIDIFKWQYFPHKLFVIRKFDLIKLELNEITFYQFIKNDCI